MLAYAIPTGSLTGSLAPAELALIADHPISKALDRDFQEAMHDPDVFGFIWLMLVWTRCIDGLMERAVRNGATQVSIPRQSRGLSSVSRSKRLMRGR